MKLVAGLTNDIKREIEKCSFDSAAEIVEETGINVSQFNFPLQLSANSSS